MTNPEIPFLMDTESQEAQYPRGSGADTILLIGKTPNAADTSTINEFYSYQDAIAELSGEDPEETNELLLAVKDVFEEGAVRSVTDKLGIEKVLAINVGPNPVVGTEWADAQELGRLKRDIAIEVYVGLSDISFMNTTKTHLDTLAATGKRRIAIFTHAADESKTNIIDMTDPSNAEDTPAAPYIQGSRIYIKQNRLMQCKFAAKVACTPYWQDPARGPYRSVTFAEVEEQITSEDDLDDYTKAGIVVDWENLNPVQGNGKAEICKAVATSYRGEDDVIPLDARLHIRRNADYQFRQIDLIIGAELKNNDTETGLQTMQQNVNAYLAGEVKKGYIKPKKTEPQDPGYLVEIIPHDTNPYGVKVRRKIRPVNSIEFIEEESVILAPL